MQKRQPNFINYFSHVPWYSILVLQKLYHERINSIHQLITSKKMTTFYFRYLQRFRRRIIEKETAFHQTTLNNPCDTNLLHFQLL